MTPEEMRAKSAEKVKRVMDLASSLELRIEARQKIDSQGFIQSVVFWADEEKYPQPQPEAPAPSDTPPTTVDKTDTVTA